jgi:hypothetical protein
MSIITESMGAVIYQRLMRNLYLHLTKRLEAMLLGYGYMLDEGGAMEFVPDHIINDISHDFWRFRIRYECPQIADEDLVKVVHEALTDGRPQLIIREILAALAADGIVPALVRQN